MEAEGITLSSENNYKRKLETVMPNTSMKKNKPSLNGNIKIPCIFSIFLVSFFTFLTTCFYELLETSHLFWRFCGLMLWLYFLGWVIILIYESFYYNSEKFLTIKKSIQKNTVNCNQLNQHIEELQQVYINTKKDTDNVGKAECVDNSIYNYKRPEFNKELDDNSYQTSLSVCRNARNQPFKYICKYFNIPFNEKSLERFEHILNDFSAAEQGKELLLKERERILNSIKTNVPQILIEFRKNNLMRKLGFDDV